ncbi:MAG: hypothetical protein M1838_002369 [Thelocarpon superellum]|nr:MAG: hypothetical protein M1838_002369 [Thelocarpon superellum]
MNSNADLDRLLRFPIGLSQRAGGGAEVLGDVAFRNQADAPGEIFETSLLEIWKRGDQFELSGPASVVPTGSWVEDLARAEDVQPGRGRLVFQLLLTRPGADDKYPWPRCHDRSTVGRKQIYFLPFPRRDLKKLMQRWHLPADWLYLRLQSKGVGNFFRKTAYTRESGAAERMSFVLHFPFVLSTTRRYTGLSWSPAQNMARFESIKSSEERERLEEKLRNGDPFIWSIAYSHNLLDGTATCLFDGVTDRATEDLTERLRTDEFRWAEHPLYLLMVLMDMYVGHTIVEARYLDTKEWHLEDKWARTDPGELDKEIAYFGSHSRNLVYLERVLDFELKLTDFLLETLAYLDRVVVNPRLPRQSTSDSWRLRVDYLACVNLQMEESVRNTANLLHNQLHRCQCLQKRAVNELGIVQAFIAREDNRINLMISEENSKDSKVNIKIAEASTALAFDSKQDSTSMMTISILTMCFLPATAVATICSMGMFDWTADAVNVSPHFWIYWAVTLPLTACLMGAWCAWFFLYRKPRMIQERKRMECEMCRSLSGTSTQDGKRYCKQHCEVPSKGGRLLEYMVCA